MSRRLIERPSHRSGWVINANRAVYLAERAKARNQVGSHPLPLQQRVKTVEVPIPTLMTGPAKAKELQFIAACAISKSWRKKHAEDFKQSAYRISTKANEKPDIEAFLERFPEPDENDGDDEQDDEPDNEQEVEEDATGAPVVAGDDHIGWDEGTGESGRAGDGLGDGDVGSIDKGKGKDTGGEDGPEDGEDGEAEDESEQVHNELGVGGLGLEAHPDNYDMSVIHPDLRPGGALQYAGRPQPQPNQGVVNAPLAPPIAVPPFAPQMAPNPAPAFPSNYPHLPAHMMPPPFPPPQTQPEPIVNKDIGVKTKKPRKNPPKNSTTGSAPSASSGQVASVPAEGSKKRGRPPGSKNKPKDLPPLPPPN
ncbi:hypothetical protein BDV93DRAFT_562104 [Ceratobasidium sp. AG-I]|nr:hypothetical protein BDV93DRAFT_562104 [Ceratobasidium sp. AG-I]